MYPELGSPLAGPPAARTDYEQALLDRAARWPAHTHWSDLTPQVVRGITATEGIDFATALLYDRLVRSPEHGPFIARLPASPRVDEPVPRLDATLAIVPGAFYREFPHTGADGKLLREEAARFGCQSELVPLKSFGSLADNARTLCDWLLGRPGEPLILASLSKGGAEVKMALARPEAERAFRHVVCWINLSGLLSGTPLVSWVHASRARTWWFRLLFWLRGYDFRVLPELAWGPGTPLDFEPRLPGHLKAIHLVGFPLVRHLSNALARRCHRRVARLGPNDGAGILLADVGRLPGLVYPVWGADHYLRPGGRDLRALAGRILHFLSDEWNCLVPGRVGPKGHPV